MRSFLINGAIYNLFKTAKCIYLNLNILKISYRSRLPIHVLITSHYMRIVNPDMNTKNNYIWFHL